MSGDSEKEYGDDEEYENVGSVADSLYENIFSSIFNSITKFDQERDEFLKSLGPHSRSLLLQQPNDLSSSSVVNQSQKYKDDDIKQRCSYLNVVPQQPSSKHDIITKSMSHPLKQKFSPRLLAKYPQSDYPDEDSFPSYIPMFCFPNDIMIKESEDCPPATFHGFVMTQEDGSKRYGVCLTTYYAPLPDHLIEELEVLHKKWCEANMAPSELEYIKHLLEKVKQERRRVETAKATISLQRSSNTTMGDKNDELDEILKEKADAEDKLDLYLQLLEPIKLGVFDSTKLWLPKAIGIVSHFPWHDILKDWLCAVVMPMVDSLKENNHNRLKTRLPLERYIVNLVHEIPLPPPGKAQVAISVNDMTLFCSRPALNQKPILKDVALSEGKILLISSFPDMLYLVAHSITYLLYPFYWQGVFIPVLPARLMACLQAPVPYIMGIERQYKGMDLLPEDSIRNKALARNSVFGVNKLVTPLKISHTAPSSIDIRLSPPQLSMSSSSEATTSNSSIDNLSLFDDSMSVMSVLTESEQRVLPEKNYIPKEGHLMAQIFGDDDDEQFTGKCGMNILIFEGIACGICNESLGINLIYKCEGCSMMIHEECLSDIVYPCVPACFNEAKVQDAFLRVFSSFLQNYRSFMLNNNDNNNYGTTDNYSRSGESNEFLDDSEIFNKDLFLKSVDRESKPFLSQLVDSQAFSQFINQRVNAKKTSVGNYDVQYFDEVIKAKLNRSKLRFSKESTTFLDDSTYAISQTIRSMKPNEEGLEDFEGYIHLPDSFDHGIMNNPRPIKKGWL
ncbi:14217_t:CDS:10 [Entrophospora sp. SA101]|nr:4781_t:CDS:10 [Entrophospora sp. SA101]CAJ0899998.1 14217_t:CDS:10 [Entrophospora sp. SA101]